MTAKRLVVHGLASVLTWVILVLVSATAQATISEENCCEFTKPDECTSRLDLDESTCAQNEGRFVPGGICSKATQRCAHQQARVATWFDGPGWLIKGEQVELGMTVRNTSSGLVTVGDLAAHFTLPGKSPAIGPINVPVDPPVILAPGASFSRSLGVAFIPSDIPSGYYTAVVEAFESGGMFKLGVDVRPLMISGAQASHTDPSFDCLVADTSQPAPAADCTPVVDLLRVHANVSLPNLYLRAEYRGALSSTLQAGESSRSWNLVFGGGMCTFGRFGSVGFVANFEEKQFNQPDSPIRGRWFGCQGGALSPLAGIESPGYTIEGVGKNFLVFGLRLPPGLNPVGGNMGVANFGLRQGGTRVLDDALFLIPSGSDY